MKKVIYQNLYKLLTALSAKINNRHINRYKIAVGTTLLFLTSGCQVPKKNNKSDGGKDSIYSDTTQTKMPIDEDILCYEAVAEEEIIKADTTPPPPPPPPPTVSVIDIVTCYEPIIPMDCYIIDIDPLDVDSINTQKADTIDTNEVFMVVEQMPEFPGGSQALLEFIKSNIYYPEEYGDICVQGRVIIQFIIEKDGSVSDPQILRGIDPKLDKIALEVINKLPNFTPGVQNGKTVRVKYTVPVVFRF